MLDALRRMLRQYDLISPGDRVICALSGGPDSMALLWALYLIREELGIDLEAAHFNHQLRGEESDREQTFVEDFCRGYGIPLTVGTAPVTPGKKGLEAAARDARYRFLESLPGKIATAHTASDNAETVLQHLVRGTGLKGLGGIAPRRGRVIRPLLLTTREQVMAFLAEYHLPYAVDSSNGTDAFLRNRLRHSVMPLLRRENPRLDENLSCMALSLRQEEAALAMPSEFPDGLSLERLRSLPQGLQGRLARTFLESCGVAEPERRHVQALLDLAASARPSARLRFPGGVTVSREYDRLIPLAAEPSPQSCVLTVPGQAEFGPWQVEARPGPDGLAVCGQIVVRSRQSGDRLRLPGGTRSLKKLFIDRRIPAARRDRIPVVADDRGVLAVAGIGENLDRVAPDGPGVHIIFTER